MRARAGLAAGVVAGVVAVMPFSAAASGDCNDGQVTPETVSGPLQTLATATGLQALNSLHQHVKGLPRLESVPPVNEVCKRVP